MPGDEIKFIDWKVFARTDRYYVKQVRRRDQSSLHYHCGFQSASMNYASRGISPSLSMRVIWRPDGVYDDEAAGCSGLALYDTEVRSYLPSRSKRSYLRNSAYAGNAAPTNQTGTGAALSSIADRIARRGGDCAE